MNEVLWYPNLFSYRVSHFARNNDMLQLSSFTICPSDRQDLWLTKSCGLNPQATMAIPGCGWVLLWLSNAVAYGHSKLWPSTAANFRTYIRKWSLKVKHKLRFIKPISLADLQWVGVSKMGTEFILKREITMKLSAFGRIFLWLRRHTGSLRQGSGHESRAKLHPL